MNTVIVFMNNNRLPEILFEDMDTFEHFVGMFGNALGESQNGYTEVLNNQNAVIGWIRSMPVF